MNTSLPIVNEVAKTSLFQQLLRSDYLWYITKIWLAIVVFLVLVMISKFIASIVSKKFLEHSVENDDKTLSQVSGLVYDITFYVLLIISLFVGFQIAGFDVGVILGGVSFGVGFAFREVLGNMIAGIMILTTKEFKLWDVIELDGRDHYFGRIEEITIRYTVIRTLDLRQVIIPNMTLISNPIRTYSAEDMIKLKTTIQVHYDTDLDQATQLMMESINSIDRVQEKSKTKIYVSDYLDGVELTGYFYFDPNSGMLSQYAIGEVSAMIQKAFVTHEIVIPYPHTVITMDHNDQNILGTLKFIKEYTTPATTSS